MALESITQAFKSGMTIVLQQIPATDGGGCSMYSLHAPETREDFWDTKEAVKYIDGCKEAYTTRNNGSTLYVTINKEVI